MRVTVCDVCRYISTDQVREGPTRQVAAILTSAPPPNSPPAARITNGHFKPSLTTFLLHNYLFICITACAFVYTADSHMTHTAIMNSEPLHHLFGSHLGSHHYDTACKRGLFLDTPWMATVLPFYSILELRCLKNSLVVSKRHISMYIKHTLQPSLSSLGPGRGEVN